MTKREKEIEEAVTNYEMGYEPQLCAGEFFRDGILWADEHPSIDTVNHIIDVMADFPMDGDINKLAEYIVEHWKEPEHKEYPKVYISVGYNAAEPDIYRKACQKLVEMGGIEPVIWHNLAYIDPVLYINNNGTICETNRDFIEKSGFTEIFLNT